MEIVGFYPTLEVTLVLVEEVQLVAVFTAFLVESQSAEAPLDTLSEAFPKTLAVELRIELVPLKTEFTESEVAFFAPYHRELTPFPSELAELAAAFLAYSHAA